MWCEENSLNAIKSRGFSDALIANQRRYNLEHTNNIINSSGALWASKPLCSLTLRQTAGGHDPHKRRIWVFCCVRAYAAVALSPYARTQRLTENALYRGVSGILSI